MRLLNLIVAAALVLAAGYVYKSKFAATVEAERVAKLRTDITRERDMIAALRAETAKLEAPLRIQGLAQRHLSLKALDLEQIDTVDAIPFPAPDLIKQPRDEPVIASSTPADTNPVTGSVPKPAVANPPTGSSAPKPAATTPATGGGVTPSPPHKPRPVPSANRRAPPPPARKPAAPVAAVTPPQPATAPWPDPDFAPPRPPAEVSSGARATAYPR